MAIIQQALDKLQLFSCVATAAVTSTTTSAAIDLKEYDGDVSLILTSAAGTGTSPTLDVKVQDSDASDGTYGDLSGAAFTQVTDAVSMQVITFKKDEAKRYIKIVQTVGGSTPSFTFSINGLALNKYG